MASTTFRFTRAIIVVWLCFSGQVLENHAQLIGSTLLPALETLIGIGGTINDQLSNISLRHPESGGRCMDISGAYPFPGGQVITYPCSYGLGFLPPVNQVFTGLPGATGDSNRYRPNYAHTNVCIYAGRNENDPLFTIECGDGDQERMSFRRLAVDGRAPRVLLQQVATGRCLRPDGDFIRAVNCNSGDTWQHWIVCPSGDQGCGF